jgi:hypothetical protein
LWIGKEAGGTNEKRADKKNNCRNKARILRTVSRVPQK